MYNSGPKNHHKLNVVDTVTYRTMKAIGSTGCSISICSVIGWRMEAILVFAYVSSLSRTDWTLDMVGGLPVDVLRRRRASVRDGSEVKLERLINRQLFF